MRIGDFDLDRDILVVAEIGNNHEGDFALAQEMIGLAARAGADAVKFQTIVPERLVSPRQEERLAQLRRFQLPRERYGELLATARREKVLFLSTPFDVGSAGFLEPLVPAYKISSGDNTFFPLLEAVAGTGKPVLLSGGAADLEEIRGAKEFVEGVWRSRGIRAAGLAILHCNVSYPTPPEDANLAAIRQIASLGVTAGYSDHCLGIGAAVLSVAFGARVVEKHFTVRKDHSGYRDHRLSADPAEFREMALRIREAAVMAGDGVKRVTESERANRIAVRRSIVARRSLPKGTLLLPEHLDWIRPGTGLPPGREGLLVHRRLNRDVAAGEPIRASDVEAE